MSDAPTVALLGTGTMGAGMARNLASAGLDVRVWNRSKDRAAPLSEDGCAVATDLADAVRGAGVVITMLYDAASVLDTMGRALPALSEAAVWAQMSTVGVTGTDDAAAWAAEHGLTFVDAPVLGTRQPAEQGKLVVLASGPDSARAALEPVFDAVGVRTMWLGEAGNGTRLKLVANGWVLTALEGIAESLRMAEALGLDPTLFLDAVQGGAMDAPYVGMKGKAMLAGEFDPAFALSGALKDAGLIEDASVAAGFTPELVQVARGHLQSAEDAGHGEKDMSATYLER